jgi:hypothetical protein
MDHPALTDPQWVDKVHATIVPIIATKAPVARRGQRWLSKASAKRADVLWAMNGSVCLTYNDGISRITLKEDVLVRLYTLAKNS